MRHDVQRPPPPQTAVISIPAAWAARSTLPSVITTSRRAVGSAGSVSTVSVSATSLHSSARDDGILTRMNSIDLETLRRSAGLAGFDFSASELEPLRPAIERALQALARLEALPLSAVEPVTQYRVV